MKCSYILYAVIFAICIACGPSKLATLKSEQISTTLRLPSEEEEQLAKIDTTIRNEAGQDLVVKDLEGNDVLIMRAVKDEQTGEMVASEEIQAAVVSARFRNVAERNGRVNLEFQIIIPKHLRDSKWQLRLHPDMFVLEDSLRLDDVVVTGDAYRKEQLRGYQRYERFLKKIISDSLKFIDLRNLEIFLSRNIPELYAFKTDSTFVNEEEFVSSFGVNSQEALEHYTRQYLLDRNQRLSNLKEKMWRKYIKLPIITEGIRLDTVLVGDNSELIYNYIQTINTRPGLRKVDVVLGGEIFEEDTKIYDVPVSEPLTFYVSSVSSFVDDEEKYLTKVIARDLENSTKAIIEFKTGDSKLDEKLSDNFLAINGIKKNIRELLEDDKLVIDSLLIVASSSPDGTEKNNIALSEKRAKEVSNYFSVYVNFLKDSLKREDAMVINLADFKREEKPIVFKARSGGENWNSLDYLVEIDSALTEVQKADYFGLKTITDFDKRERELRQKSCFAYIHKNLYPKLRTVHFNMYLHRKGMIKDTIHTSVLDTNYMEGLKALKDHDYHKAVVILSPYQDFNAALAFVALDRNASAMQILETKAKTAKVNYLLAIIYSRLGDDRKAVEHYLHSCEQEPSFVHRGNLDPEISLLINKYKIHNDYE